MHDGTIDGPGALFRAPPADWKTFKMNYRYRETVYHITILQTCTADNESSLTVYGVEPHDQAIPLVNDCQEHYTTAFIDHAHTE